MQAIITTNGPVVNHQSIKNRLATKKHNINTVSVQQFTTAGLKLQAMNLGMFVKCGGAHVKSTFFIKKHPDEVAPILESFQGLCYPSVYANKFHKAASASVTWKQRAALVSEGYVSEKMFMKK